MGFVNQLGPPTFQIEPSNIWCRAKSSREIGTARTGHLEMEYLATPNSNSLSSYLQIVWVDSIERPKAECLGQGHARFNSRKQSIRESLLPARTYPFQTNQLKIISSNKSTDEQPSICRSGYIPPALPIETGNRWTENDLAVFEKIHHLGLEQIVQLVEQNYSRQTKSKMFEETLAAWNTFATLFAVRCWEGRGQQKQEHGELRQ